jgi:formyl-CoA transferase
MSSNSRPLEGIMVLDLTTALAGPYATFLLAGLGASVIKIENRETGDLSRWLTCGLIGGPEAKNPDVSFYFTAMNRGKRSITLDLKKPGGIALIHRLAKSCDVLLTNYRPGVLDRLGLSFDDCSRTIPKSSMRRRVHGGQGRGSNGRAAYAGAGGERPDGETGMPRIRHWRQESR